MGVKSFNDEVTSVVAPSRLFKGLVLDFHTLGPKLLPDASKSVELIPGDGTSPALVHVILPDGTSVKHRFDVVDKERNHCKYTLIEGPELKNGVVSIVRELKIEGKGDGGSLCKKTLEVHAADVSKIDDGLLKTSKEMDDKLFKAIETYLIENPNA